MSRLKYVAGALGVLVVLHLLLSLHSDYRSHTTGFLPSSWTKSGSGYKDLPIGSWQGSEYPPAGAIPEIPTSDELRLSKDKLKDRPRAKAVIFSLARNSDLYDLLGSMKQMEDRFNHWAQYDYIFLNDDDFSDEFKEKTQALTSATCKYGKIDPDHWHQPDWIDEEKATAARKEMTRKKVIYGHSVPYRNMCRFNSGFFYRHPLLDDYDYYWRMEPSVKYFCDLDYDPFLLMQEQGKQYGFTLSLYEYIETIPTLWNATKEFIQLHPEFVAEGNSMDFLSSDGGETYNLCHFWSNFEIGDLNLWRSDAYMKYFQFLDDKGGFYYERWGDAPVHSIAAALFLPKEKIHWFDDIGYRHDPFQHCPQNDAHKRGKCWCNPGDNFDFEGYSCTQKWVDLWPKK
ncbi:hypothetical protein Q8F55_006298 [Vanrija albida]|uniref:Glycosyltransferase family 15 protein n=1 Tax=Vanrija albida TaxID=181172 RepID=A0ABR3PWR7_9TREE